MMYKRKNPLFAGRVRSKLNFFGKLTSMGIIALWSSLVSITHAERLSHEELVEALKKEATKPLEDSDESSVKVMDNFSIVIGAKAAGSVRNVVARGQFAYGKEDKEFELIETSRGERCLILRWRYMGRDYKETIVSQKGKVSWREISKQMVAANGDRSWERVFLEIQDNSFTTFREQFGRTVVSDGQQLRARQLDYEDWRVISGSYGEVPSRHFRSMFMFLQPFLLENDKALGYEFKGIEKLKGRESYVLRHGRNRYFHFDKERFLLVQWGGAGQIGGEDMYIYYRAVAFKRWDSMLFPSKISIIGKNVELGSYTIEFVEVNSEFDSSTLEVPEI